MKALILAFSQRGEYVFSALKAPCYVSLGHRPRIAAASQTSAESAPQGTASLSILCALLELYACAAAHNIPPETCGCAACAKATARQGWCFLWLHVLQHRVELARTRRKGMNRAFSGGTLACTASRRGELFMNAAPLALTHTEEKGSLVPTVRLASRHVRRLEARSKHRFASGAP